MMPVTSRIEEQPARAVQQHEAQMPPGVAPAAQVRRTAPAIRRERRRHLGDTHLEQRGLDDHLAGKLHPGGVQVHPLDGGLAEAAQAAVEITHGRAEKQPSDARQHRVAQVPVQGRHGARLNAAPEAVAHHQVAAFSQLLDERHEIGEVVAVVGVAHDDVPAAGGGDGPHERGAIAAYRDVDNARARTPGDLLRAIRAAVVADHDLAGDVVLPSPPRSGTA